MGKLLTAEEWNILRILHDKIQEEVDNKYEDKVKYELRLMARAAQDLDWLVCTADHREPFDWGLLATIINKLQGILQ